MINQLSLQHKTFLKITEVTSPDSFCRPTRSPKPKCSSFASKNDKEKQQIFTFKSKYLTFLVEKWQKRLNNYQTSWGLINFPMISSSLQPWFVDNIEQRTQQILNFQKLEPDNIQHFCVRNASEMLLMKFLKLCVRVIGRNSSEKKTYACRYLPFGYLL